MQEKPSLWFSFVADRQKVYVPVTDESIFAAVVTRSSLSFVFLLYDKDGGGAFYGGCLVRWC